MTPIRSSALFLAVAVTAVVPAQNPPAASHESSLAEIPWTLGSGPFTRVVAGSFLPGPDTDAIVVRGGTMGIVVAVGVHTYIEAVPFPGTVTDIAKIENGNLGDSSRDAIVVTDDLSGTVTRMYWYDDAWQSATSSMPGWQGAGQLAAAPDGTGTELAAVAQDGQTILRARVDASGISHVSAASLSRTVIGLAVADDNGDGVLESFFLTALGVHVFRRSGTYVRTELGNHPGGVIANINGRVSWLRRDAENLFYELILLNGAAGIEDWPTITLDGSDFDAVGMAPGDLDQMNDQDILISQRTTQQALSVRLSVDPSEPETLVADTTVLDLTSTPTASGAPNQCVAAVADFDGDGFDDLLAPLNTWVRLSLLRGIAARIGVSTPFDELLHQDTVFDWGTPNNGVASGLYLRLRHGGLFEEHTHVRVELWWQADRLSNVGHQGLYNVAYEITDPGSAPESHSVYVPPWQGFDSPGFFHLVIRFEDHGSTPVSAGPVFVVAGFSFAGIEAATTYIEDGNSHLTSIRLDDADIVGVSREDPDEGEPETPPGPGPGRILIGGTCRTWSVSPLSNKPSSAAAGPDSSTVPAGGSGG